MIPIKRILLVDDEPEILQTLRMILLREGYAVETAWSSKEALEILKHNQFQLVVTDFNMPGMKGDELAAIIKSNWPHTPVLMLTGSVEVIRSTGRAMPEVDALISKPFSVAALRAEISTLISATDSPGNLIRLETEPALAAI